MMVLLQRLRRAACRWRWQRDYEKSLNVRAGVEQDLWDCAHGQRPLPDAEQCREWARRLGVPAKWRAEK